MTETETATPTAPNRNLRGWVGDMPRWKKISLIAAGALLVTGAVLMIVNPGAPPATGGTGGTGGSALQSSLTDGQPGGSTTGGESASEPAAKGVFRLGFSFIAGFALGSFLRAMLRIAAIALGFWLAMTLALAYYGLVDVNWDGIDSLWSHFWGNVESEWGSFQSFVTGSLPAAALVTVGFAVGIKRH